MSFDAAFKWWIKSYSTTKLVNKQAQRSYFTFSCNHSIHIHSYDTPMILSTKLLKICVSGAG